MSPHALSVADNGEMLAQYAHARLSDLVLFPASRGDSENGHWTLVAAFPLRRTIVHYDSRGGTFRACEQASQLAHFLAPGGPSEWHFGDGVIPRQQNGVDCGVLILEVARSLMLDRPSNINPFNTAIIRNRMMLELLTWTLR